MILLTIGRLQEYFLDDVEGAVLDALVAREIFGIEYVKHDHAVINGRRIDVPTWFRVGDDPSDPPAGWSAGTAPPNYSFDMEAAMDVVDEMNTRGPCYTFALWSVCCISSVMNRPAAVFCKDVHPPSFPMNEQEEAKLFIASSKNKAEAICRAALKAIRSEQHANWRFL